MAKIQIELGTRYEPKSVEERIYGFWESGGYFHAEPDEREKYSIVIPPPNVTSALHMGHALNNTIQDVLIRWRRMQGYNTLWMPGTDHAGIATQNVVERDLAKRGLTRHDLGREKFVQAVWEWKEKYGARIINQLKRLGCSCDWERERFTMDEGLSAAVREAFVKLYEMGLIYRGKYITNWCPRCRTALSDDEVEHEEHEGHLWYIKYPFKDEPHLHISVATTRPETMLGDTAVAVHPDDLRYKELIGKTLILPIVEREIPIIADESVDPEFGTGAVKVTPAHDPNDFLIAQRHGLESVVVMNPDGTMNENAGEYEGMDRFECRESLVEELKLKKLIEVVEPYTHSVGHCYRCHTVIEPYLSDQWFVKMKPLAEKAIEATRTGKVNFHPERWTRFYLSWLENVRDWCISRQIWWGHRIPAWYCSDCGKVTVSRTDPTECAHCNSKNIHQDEDVLDTWFSSDLWPFSTFGWPERTKELEYYYPTSVLVTARDIIYLWVARMVMMGLCMMNEVPFRDVYIHATILDDLGRKMSKSLGNVIDPIEMIEKYGCDAVRFSLIMLTVEGQDMRLSESKFEMGRNFANKIWNAARLVFMNLDGDIRKPEGDMPLEDRWILSKLNSVIKFCNDSLEAFRFNDAARSIYDFAWHDFCDWYLEIVKPRLRSGGESGATARYVMIHVLDNILRLLHPFMPFVTEEIWQKLRQTDVVKESTDADALIVAEYPAFDEGRLDRNAEETVSLLQGLVRGVRNIRSHMNIPPRQPLKAILSTPDEGSAQRIEANISILRDLAVLSDVEVGVNLSKPPASAVEVVEGIEMFVPLGGVIDVQAEMERLMKRIKKAETALAVCEAKLNNENFIRRAPTHIVEREHSRRKELLESLAILRRNYESLK